MLKLINHTILSSLLAMATVNTAAAEEIKTTNESTDLVTLNSVHDFNTTVEKLQSTFTAKGLTIFTVIDHAKAAKSAGLVMPATTVIVFGNPKGGTPLMKKAPKLALQLPLKVLVAENADKIEVSFFKASFLATSVGESKDLTLGLSKIEKLITKIVTKE